MHRRVAHLCHRAIVLLWSVRHEVQPDHEHRLVVGAGAATPCLLSLCLSLCIPLQSLVRLLLGHREWIPRYERRLGLARSELGNVDVVEKGKARHLHRRKRLRTEWSGIDGLKQFVQSFKNDYFLSNLCVCTRYVYFPIYLQRTNLVDASNGAGPLVDDAIDQPS
jgi:hypothetical protein